MDQVPGVLKPWVRNRPTYGVCAVVFGTCRTEELNFTFRLHRTHSIDICGSATKLFCGVY